MLRYVLEYAVVENGKTETLGLFVHSDEAHVLADGLSRDDGKRYDVVSVEPITVLVELHK